jgi:Lhr-like helicase
MMGNRLSVDYLATLSDHNGLDALRACLMIYALSSHTIVPHIFQLQASLAILNRGDTIITAGTGSGKTLCLLIPMLLRPQSIMIMIMITPLK